MLGGAEVPVSILGFIPANWVVYPFGSLDVVDFLRSIDVFVYFHHPNWVESFGRVIAEAMASGLPTILPTSFQSRCFKQELSTPSHIKSLMSCANLVVLKPIVELRKVLACSFDKILVMRFTFNGSHMLLEAAKLPSLLSPQHE